jgi:hypothetical protein
MEKDDDVEMIGLCMSFALGMCAQPKCEASACAFGSQQEYEAMWSDIKVQTNNCSSAPMVCTHMVRRLAVSSVAANCGANENIREAAAAVCKTKAVLPYLCNSVGSTTLTAHAAIALIAVVYTALVVNALKR